MAVIILTKADLVDDSGGFTQRASKLAPAVQVEAVNALQGDTLECLGPWLKSGQTIALRGKRHLTVKALQNAEQVTRNPGETPK